MSERITFTVYGEPVAKGRARVTTIGKHARAYTPAKTVKAESDLLLQSMKHKPDEPFTEALYVGIDIYRSIPKSFSKKNRADAISGLVRPITRPDNDNYVKLVLDALNGVFWKDDSIIVDLHPRKWYAEEPRTEITIETLEDE